jgi:hypothetical protein
MIRCYMCADKAVGFGHQLIKALLLPPPEGPESQAEIARPELTQGRNQQKSNAERRLKCSMNSCQTGSNGISDLCVIAPRLRARPSALALWSIASGNITRISCRYEFWRTGDG